MRQNTILVLGTNSGQLDLIKYMKSIDWNVVSCSYRQGEIGEAFSDFFYLVDIRDIQAVSDLAVKIKADLVYSVSSDVAMTTAVQVSEKLSLPHFYNSDMIELFNNKQELRKHLNKYDLGKVEFSIITEESNALSWSKYPCIVKPTDSQGQRGVQKVNNAKKLDEAIKIAQEISLSNTTIVEEFLDGVEISCNVLVNKGAIVFDILSERLVYDGKFMGIPKGHLIPCLNVSPQDQEEALNLVHKITKSLNIKNGSLYFQMKVTKTGIKVIEIAPRLDGCHMWRLIENATNNNYLANTVQTLLGKCELSKKVTLKNSEMYELMFQHTPAGRKFFKDDFPIPENVLYHEYRYKDNDEINPINGRLEVVGYYTKTYLVKDRQNYIEESTNE
ncbi:MAG TPA: ATP-grasp domain-containing protein [Sulfurimonas sp.]|nr:ATP-grasp domain-containing protein [Sulfurimonas sp.]